MGPAYQTTPNPTPQKQEIRGRATTESVVVESGNAPFGAGNDGHGHGTHCAGTAAGLNVGIAPSATIRCIKVGVE